MTRLIPFLKAFLLSVAVGSVGSAHAAPYAITYQGTIADSAIASIHDGQRYTVTFVMDNGGSTAVNQSWEIRHLTCAIWRMNDAADVRVAWPGLRAQGQGQARTDAGGALVSMFNSVVEQSSAAFTSVGMPAGTSQLDWFLNYSMQFVRNDDDGFAETRGDGSVLRAANWSAPTPFGGSCSVDAAPHPGNTVNSVPTVGLPALVLLTFGAAALGGRRLNRYRMLKDTVYPATSRSTRRELHRLASNGSRASSESAEDEVA